MQDYQKRLAELGDDTVPVATRVQLIEDVCNDAGYGDTLREFIAAGGIKALIELARKEWPPNGRLSSSDALEDVVKTITGGPLSIGARLSFETPMDALTQMDRDQRVKYPCSVRRMVTYTLAEMGNYE